MARSARVDNASGHPATATLAPARSRFTGAFEATHVHDAEVRSTVSYVCPALSDLNLLSIFGHLVGTTDSASRATLSHRFTSFVLKLVAQSYQEQWTNQLCKLYDTPSAHSSQVRRQHWAVGLSHTQARWVSLPLSSPSLRH